MATASPAEDNIVHCSICLDNFKDPRLLPCGHVLCYQCVKTWTLTQHNAGCPQCSYPIIENRMLVSQSLESAVDGLPPELSLVALAEADHLMNQQLQCVICNATVTCLCLDCGDMFCQTCRNFHNKQTVTKHHKVEQLSTLTPDMNQPIKCTIHAGKPLEYYCPTHNKEICHVCAVKDHKSCTDVQDVNAHMTETRRLLTDLITTMKDGENKLDCAVRKLSQHLQETEGKVQDLCKEIAAVFDRLDVALKVGRQRLNDLTVKAFSDVKTDTNNAKTHLLRDKGLLVSHGQSAQRSLKVIHVEKCKSSKTMYSELNSRMGRFNCDATLLANAKAVPSIKLEIDQTSLEQLEKALMELGEVKLVPTDLIKIKKKRPELHRPLQEWITSAHDEARHWQFHNNHGQHVSLNDNLQTAVRRRGRGYDHGIVLSHHAMEVNMVYEIRVDQTDNTRSRNHIVIGVTSQWPDTVDLPSWPGGLSPAVVVYPYSVYINTLCRCTKQFIALKDTTVGSRVGVLLDTDHHVHVFIDGQDLGVVPSCPPVTLPAYAVFNVDAYMTKVTAVPLSRVL